MMVTAMDGVLPSRDALTDRFRRKYWELRAESESEQASGGIQRGGAVRPLRLDSVIVPLDGSRYAEHAIPLASQVASACQATMTLESADLLFGRTFDHMSLSFEEASSPRRRNRMHRYLKELAARLECDSVRVVPRLREAPIAARSLTEVAQASSLIVLAQRPRRFTIPLA